MPTLTPSIGDPYPGVQAEYNFRGGDHELRISLSFEDDKLSEVEQVIRFGPVEFGMYSERGKGLLLIARFGQWLPLPSLYHFWREAQATGDRTPPPDPRHLSPELRDRLRIVLVDADTGEEERPREVSFSPEFTRRIRRAIAYQVTGAYNADQYDWWVATMTRRTTDDLWRQCTAYSCET
jgi:hypothetical protein